MTADSGLGLCVIHEEAIDAAAFNDFLKKLRQRFGGRPLALFMDQLRVHKAKAVAPSYQALDILPIFNVGYSPELNPIEAVFSRVKYQYCRQRLHNLVNKTGWNADREIEAALGQITKAHCAACVRKS